MDSMPTFGQLIKRIHCALLAEASSHFTDIDLTPQQAHVLIFLRKSDQETARMKDLEHNFHCAQSTMAGIIARLEKKELIQSFVLSDDHRVKCVRLTDDGRSLCDRSHASIEAAESKILEQLTPSEREQAYALLQKMYAAVGSPQQLNNH